MNAFSHLRAWLQRVLGRDQLERDLQDEMQLHIDLLEADLRARGVSDAEARRQSRAAFGSLEAKKDEARTVLGLRWLDEVRADIGYALRLLRRSPGFTAIAMLSLGLGIGANTAIFNLIDTILLKQLPVRDPAALFFIDNSAGKSGGSSGPPFPCFELLRDRNTTMSGLAAFDDARLKVTIDGVAEEMFGQYATGDFFKVLGLTPQLGRLLMRSDDRITGRAAVEDSGVAVISDKLWRYRFNRNPNVVGREIKVGTHPVTIVGVAPPEYFGLQVGLAADIIVPMGLSDNNLGARSLWWFSVVGRIKPGVDVQQARAELHHLWDGYMNDIGQPLEKRKYFSGIELVPASRGLAALRRQMSEPLLITMTIVGLVLLIGCANVANLLLARVSARQNELSVRLAVGASRSRLMRQLFTEGAVLSACGAICGALFAKWGVSFLVAILARADDGSRLTPAFDGRLLAFTISVAILSALLFSLAPMLQALRVDAPRPPAGGVTSRGFLGGRVGQAMVLVQVVLSIVLLSAAAMFLRTLQNLHDVNTGFQSRGVIAIPVEAQFPRPTAAKPTHDEVVAYHGSLNVVWRRMIDSVATLPGVEQAAVATLTPFTGRDRGVVIAISGGEPLGDDVKGIHINTVTEGYFKALSIPVTSGRAFTAADGAGAPRVAVLNRTAVKTYFGDQNPIGRRVSFPGQQIQDEFEVIGVVEDVRYVDARTVDERMAYIPLEQSIDPIRGALVVVHGAGGAPPASALITETITKMLPSGFAPRVYQLDDRIDISLTRERLLSILATFFGLLALLLACMGLYGVMAYGVVRRTREIGIRLAVGASRSRVMMLIVRDTMLLVLIGAAAGSALAVYASRFVRGMLFDIAPGDPIAMAAAVAMLIIVAVVASYLPARRASRVDPVIALRYE